MTDAERFEAILREIHGLLSALGDLANHVVLVGGQVVALRALAAGRDGSVSVKTATGIEVSRGFTFEADLLVDDLEVDLP